MMCSVHKILYFCSDQIKSWLGSASCGKHGGRKDALRVLTGQHDQKGIVHRKLEWLADMMKVFTEYYYTSNAIIVCIFGLNYSMKQNCCDLDGFTRSESVTDLLTNVHFLFPHFMFSAKWKTAVLISASLLQVLPVHKFNDSGLPAAIQNGFMINCPREYHISWFMCPWKTKKYLDYNTLCYFCRVLPYIQYIKQQMCSINCNIYWLMYWLKE